MKDLATKLHRMLSVETSLEITMECKSIDTQDVVKVNETKEGLLNRLKSGQIRSVDSTGYRATASWFLVTTDRDLEMIVTIHR